MSGAKVIVVCGPTAVGKSSLGLTLAETFGGEIVNADSTQVYRGMDVGTDKVSADELARVPHHLIDLVDPDQEYTAADYVRDARRVIAELLDRGTVPVVVGGTGFYIRSLLRGLFPQPPIDAETRAELEAQAASDAGLAALYERLIAEDPQAAERIDPHDRFRILRALEVLDSTGEPISAHWARHAAAVERERIQTPAEAVGRLDLPAPYDVLQIGLTRDRAELYAAVDARAHAQIYDGPLQAEVRALLERFPADLRAFKTLTYRHMIHLIAGEWTPEHAYEELARDTRHYARRQLTWFRAEPDVEWFSVPAQLDAVLHRAAEFLGVSVASPG